MADNRPDMPGHRGMTHQRIYSDGHRGQVWPTTEPDRVIWASLFVGKVQDAGVRVDVVEFRLLSGQLVRVRRLKGKPCVSAS